MHGNNPLQFIRSGVLLLLCLGFFGAAEAAPVRNDTPWSVLLCRFSDTPEEPHPPEFFANFLTQAGAGTGGVADYFAEQSGGRISLDGSVVRGWFPMPYAAAQSQAVARVTLIQRCVDAAKAHGYAVPANHRIVAVINADVDAGFVGGRVLLSPANYNVGFAAHQMLHAYGLGHSFSTDTAYKATSTSQPGEFDNPWDEMSARHTHSFTTLRYGTSAVGLNGFHRDLLGWLPMDRVVTVGADGVGSRTYTLAPLETPSAAGPLLLRIPFEPADPFRYYTVEYRRKTGWSQGIPVDQQLLVHEVRNGISFLVRTGAGGGPAQSLQANGVRLSINSRSASAISVTVTTDIVERCLMGYVWREARAGDKVCVTPAVRTQVAADNAVARTRWVQGPYGPHTCISGYVWREAFKGDDTCVTPSQRTQAASDNNNAALRRNPAKSVYGPNTCAVGYVWREADASDYVCVTPGIRTQVKADNSAAKSRWVNGANGPHSCASSYVWREAFKGDDACVTPNQRTQAANDNSTAALRLMRPGPTVSVHPEAPGPSLTPTAPLSITTTALGQARAGQTFSHQLEATGGTKPYVWSLVSGSLGALSLSPSGLLSGVPTVAGTLAFIVQATGGAAVASKALTLAVVPGVALSGPPQPVVVGNQLKDARTGQVWTPYGASWPGLEYSCVQGWRPQLPDKSMTTAASWGMNVVRLPLNQDCWLGVDGAPTVDDAAAYQSRVKAWVKAANDAGMAVILDLHWSAPAGTRAVGGQWPMADNQSADFWTSVAAAFKDNPSVMFELFNEPYSRTGNPLTWVCWRDGGDDCRMPNVQENAPLTGATYAVTGMATLVRAVRAAGARQPILLGGLNYSNDLSRWLVHKPDDGQLVAAWHNYKGQGCSATTCWNNQIAPVAAAVPVVITEIGYESGSPDYFEDAMTWADSKGIGYLPWAWWNQAEVTQKDYALYSGNDYAPTQEGLVFKNHLARVRAAAAPP